jgi:hypothetical protein
MRLIPCLLPVVLGVAATAGCGDGTGQPQGGDTRPSTVIEPRVGIAGVRIRARADDVEALLGKPDSTRASDLHGGWLEWRYRRRVLRITLDGSRRVWSVATYSRAYRTRDGLGVGSTESRLRDVVSELSCRPYGGPARDRRWRACADTKTYSGPFTSFILVRGRVRSVSVAQGLAR